jgi:hypothetical protein
LFGWLVCVISTDVQYQNYLQQVFEDNGTHFDEPNSIITRHHMLHQAFLDLEDKQKKSSDENEKLRDEFTRYKKSQDRMHLGLGVSLIDTQGTLDVELTVYYPRRYTCVGSWQLISNYCCLFMSIELRYR